MPDLAVSGATADLTTGVGDIDATLRTAPSRNIKVNSGVGSAILRVPGSIKATADVKTGVGSADSDFPLTAAKRGIGAVGGSLHGEINGGGTSLSALTQL